MKTRLIEAASLGREKALVRYSGFRVGAAVLADSGQIYSGCNIESASYGLTLCAERVALFKALSEGEQHFQRVCIVTASDELTPPCGACRQVIWEFCGDIPVLLANLSGISQEFLMSQLYPVPFDFEKPRR